LSLLANHFCSFGPDHEHSSPVLFSTVTEGLHFSSAS